MMNRTKSFLKFKLLSFLFILTSTFLYGEDWIVSAMKFENLQKEKTKVAQGICEELPSKILEKILYLSTRNINSDELAQRKLFELKNQRISLFLQLSSQIKTRDSLVLSVQDDNQLKKRIEEQNKKIDEIKTKINENLTNQKEIMEGNFVEPLEYEDFLSQKFITEKKESVVENILLYKNDASVLYEPSQKVVGLKPDSIDFEREMVQEKIRALITGQINFYADYLTVTVQVYSYPGSKILSSVKDYGSINDLDDIALSLYLGIRNQLSNNLPVVLKMKGIGENTSVFIDNELQKNADEFEIESGVHTIEFLQDGYKNISTSYFFEGNRKYTIEIEFEELKEKDVQIKLVPKMPGTLYANGIEIKEAEDYYPLKINGEKILSQFISEDGTSFFFYLPETDVQTINSYVLNAKTTDTSDYIEKRRRWMYTSYSILVTSLIPTFYVQGQANSFAIANNAGYLKTEADFKRANDWITASNVCTGISIGCGVWFVYELIRYLYAANSVLPSQAEIQ